MWVGVGGKEGKEGKRGEVLFPLPWQPSPPPSRWGEKGWLLPAPRVPVARSPAAWAAKTSALANDFLSPASGRH